MKKGKKGNTGCIKARIWMGLRFRCQYLMLCGVVEVSEGFSEWRNTYLCVNVTLQDTATRGVKKESLKACI